MLKAMLIVTALGGSGGDYTAEMPSMKECLDARMVIADQDASLKTLCVPMSDESAKMQEFFNLFMDMIEQIKSGEQENESSNTNYICDSSVEPGVIIQTFPPKINCDEEFKPSHNWLKEEPLKKW
jgi:hypothetical protein